MTQTESISPSERLAAPLEQFARLRSKTATESKAPIFSRSVIVPFVVTLALAVGGGMWAHAHTAPATAWVVIGTGSLAIILGVIGAWQLCRAAWRQQSLQRAVEWENTETLLRTQLTEQTRREQQLLTDHGKLKAELAALAFAKAELNEQLDRRRESEKKLALHGQDLARSKGVLELHVQARTEEMEKMQRRHELILDSAGEGICGLNTGGKIAFANPAAARILGGTVEKMVGRPFNEFFVNLPALPAAGQANGKPASRSELTLCRPDGSNFVLEYSRAPIHEGLRTVGEVFLFKDITERKQTEEALARKAAELARSNAELEQFAFVASHDLQEPLRKIQAFGDRLKTRCDTVDLGDGRTYLDRMQNAAARMRTLIDDLLTFSRVISRTQPFAEVNLATVAREVLADLEVRIERSGATVEVGELPVIEADPLHMRQLFQNLIGNALKFHEPGAKPVVKIAAKISDKQSELSETAIIRRRVLNGEKSVTEQWCELTVQDNGIGFDEQYLDRIFAVFQRLHGRHEYEGTGIGLAVCRRIVDRHSGMITAKSKPGAGATFVVQMPVRQARKTGSTGFNS